MVEEPKYAQVQETLRQYVRKNCAVGSRIPSTVQLEAKFGVSTGTINRAIRDLVEEGVLERFRGRGTFVAPNMKDIGFLWPNTIEGWATAPYPASVLHAVELEARRRGKHVVVRSQRQADLPEFTEGSGARVAGVLLLFFADHRVIEAYHRRHIPVVLVDPLIRATGVPFVTADHFSAAREGALYLAGLGHRRIVHLTVDAPWTTIPIAERIHGYQEAMREAGLEAYAHVCRVRPESAAGATADPDETVLARQFLSLYETARPTACLCYDDLLAFWVIRTCHDHGIRIPEDLSVVGVNDTAMASHIWPTLTTMHICQEEIGRSAVRILDELIQEHQLIGKGEVVPVRLVERCSSAAVVTDDAGLPKEVKTCRPGSRTAAAGR